MGTKMAPSFACLFVGHLEEQILYNHQNNPYLPFIVSWKRYIDDVFLLWKGSVSILLEFVEFLNGHFAGLRFTLSYSTEEINFLDMKVTKRDKSLSTSLYSKPMDRNTLLHAASFHPYHLKKSLPVSQLIRLKRICEIHDEYNENKEEMLNKFKERKYKEDWLRSAEAKVSSVNRDVYLTTKKSPKLKPNLIFCTTFTPKTRTIKEIILKHWHILQNDPNLLGTFKEPPMITYRRGRNIKDRLVRACHDPITPDKTLITHNLHGNFKCGACINCQYTKNVKSFKDPIGDKTIAIKGFITCRTKNVIYMIHCPCNKIYIGETSRPLKDRINEHRSSIKRNDLTSPVARHFNVKHPNSPLFFLGIEAIKLNQRGGNINFIWKKREAFWIFRFKSLHPRGMNEDFSISEFL